VTEPVTTETATTAKSGLDAHAFASRRTLVWRRFLRSKPAVASLIVLVLFFVGCYALPPLLPYSYTDLDFYALQQPPNPSHWFGTNALGQDRGDDGHTDADQHRLLHAAKRQRQ
jgi:peptide/nickel transport system permease protein